MKTCTTLLLLWVVGMTTSVYSQLPAFRLLGKTSGGTGRINIITFTNGMTYYGGNFSGTDLYDSKGRPMKSLSSLQNTFCFNESMGWHSGGDVFLPPNNSVHTMFNVNGTELMSTSGENPIKRKNFATGKFEPIPNVPYIEGDIVFAMQWEGPKIFVAGAVPGFMALLDTVTNTFSSPFTNAFYPQYAQKIGNRLFFSGYDSNTSSYFLATLELGDKVVHWDTYPEIPGIKLLGLSMYTATDYYVLLRNHYRDTAELWHYNGQIERIAAIVVDPDTGPDNPIKLFEHIGDDLIIAKLDQNAYGPVIKMNRFTHTILPFAEAPGGNMYDIQKIFLLDKGVSKDLVATSYFNKFYILENAQTSLPLTLLSFTGEQKGDNNMLHWVTVQEINVKEFEMERSIDGITFSRIGTVAGTNTPTDHSYQFVDANPEAVNYYRLKMVDKDGRFEYSSVIIIKNESIAKLSIYPNPTTSSITLSIESKKEEDVFLNIFNNVGQKIFQQKAHIAAGKNTISLNFSSVQKGIYYLHLYPNYDKKVSRIVKE